MSDKNKKVENKEYSARLMAVQAYYQIHHNNKPVRTVMKEYLDRGKPSDVEGQDLPAPDKVLFQKILSGVDQHFADIDGILKAHTRKEKPAPEPAPETGDDKITEVAPKPEKEIEPLLKSILICSIGEVLLHTDIDVPLIINDYLNITHAFYEKGQVSLVNGVLDKVAKLLRDA